MKAGKNIHYLQSELEQKIQEDLSIFHFIEASALDGLWYWDIENPDEEWMNARFWETLGFDPSQMPHKASAWQTLIDPDDLRLSLDNFNKHCADPNHPYDQIVRYQHAQGHTVYIRCTGMAIRDDAGHPIRMLGAHIDITQLKVTQNLLQDRVALLDQANKLAKTGTWKLDIATSTVTLGKMASRILNLKQDYAYDFDDIMGILYGVHKDKMHATLDRLKASPSTFDDEFNVSIGSDQHLWIRVIGTSVFEDGTCTHIHGVLQNIDEQVRTVRQLAHQEQLFRKTFENASIGMALVGLDGSWMRVNQSICRMVGYTEDELMALTFQDITHPEDLDNDLSLLQETLDGVRDSYVMEKRYYHKKGHLVWVLLSVAIVRDDRGNPLHFISQITDVSKSKRNELELRKSLGRLESIYQNNTQIAMIELDPMGLIVSFNEGAENLLGYKRKAVMGKTFKDLFMLEEELNERIDLSEKSYNRGAFCVVIDSVHEHGFDRHEWKFRQNDGSYLPVQMTVTPMWDENDSIYQYLAAITDISKIHEAQVEVETLLSVTTAQNDRLRNFTHIVSHNLRSHTGNLQMLLDLLSLEDSNLANHEIFPMLQEAAQGLHNTVEHLNDVINVHSIQGETMVSIDLNGLVDNVLTGIKAMMANAGAHVKIDIPKGLMVKGIPAYLDSVVLNLITNSIKYRSPKRPCEIQVSARPKKDMVVLTISDNGLGMNLAAIGDKIFGLYQTFHKHSDARGVGLFLVKNQVESMGGRIELKSKPDQGNLGVVLVDAL